MPREISDLLRSIEDHDMTLEASFLKSDQFLDLRHRIRMAAAKWSVRRDGGCRAEVRSQIDAHGFSGASVAAVRPPDAASAQDLPTLPVVAEAPIRSPTFRLRAGISKAKTMLRDKGGLSEEPGWPTAVTAPIGLRRGIVRLVPYRPEWKRLFVEEAARLRVALGERALRIEHVGSTAVDGLTAKPILDIIVAIERLSDGADAVQMLERIGYESIPEDTVADRLFLVKGAPEMRLIHLSLAEPSSACWRDHVLFRDELRAQPRAMADYARLKRRLAEQYPEDRAAYTAGKEAFIQQVIAAAMTGADWGACSNETAATP